MPRQPGAPAYLPFCHGVRWLCAPCRYAVIGRNGKGKSTLLRWLAARRVGGECASRARDSGSRDLPEAERVGRRALLA
jgi:ATPase subunit of ABC transporter with duplicated ATPase domains